MQVKTCEVCGKRAARYICQECGRKACPFCFESAAWVCLDCYTSLNREASELGSFGWSIPFKLFLLGFVLIFTGTMVMMIATVLLEASIDAGAVIWVFPLPPIGLGTGPYALWVVLLGVALTFLGLILFIVLRKRAR